MEKLLSKKKLDEYRHRKWRLGPRSRLTTLEQTADFLDDVGMCLLFACRDIPLPKIYDCAADDVNWWSWKDRLQEQKSGYIGRLARRKATLVSMELLPAFYAVYQSGGGYAMYEEEYYWGKLGELANKIAEHLDRNGPTPTDALRRAVVPRDKQSTRRFHSALLELQSKFKIVTTGLEVRSWGVRVLDLFVNWVPAKVEKKAEKMSREEAIARICLKLADTAGAVDERALPRLFGWSTPETARAADSLVADGSLVRGRLRNDRSPWLMSPSL